MLKTSTTPVTQIRKRSKAFAIIPVTFAMVSSLLTATPASATANSSMPIGNLNGWTQNIKQDFDTPAGLGQIGNVYNQDIRGYDGFTDTSKNGVYAPDKVLTVKNSALDYYLHSEQGQPLAAAAVLDSYAGQTYGKWSMRFRSDSVHGYGLAFLLWPDSNNWNDGEIDFPEGKLDGEIHGYSHNVNGSPYDNAFTVDTGLNMSEWHIVSIEWTPKSLTYIIDGVSKTTTSSSAIPKAKMHWVLQTGTDGDTPPASSVARHIQVDWVTRYAYTPNMVVTPPKNRSHESKSYKTWLKNNRL